MFACEVVINTVNADDTTTLAGESHPVTLLIDLTRTADLYDRADLR